MIHAKCDDVMQGLMAKLGFQVPLYTRTDKILLQCQQRIEPSAEKPSMRRVMLTVCNAHDPSAALPLIQQAELFIAKVGGILFEKPWDEFSLPPWMSYTQAILSGDNSQFPGGPCCVFILGELLIH